MRVLNHLLVTCMVAIMLLCNSQLGAQITADFTANVTTGCSLPFQVQFTNLSTTGSGTINQRLWNFGNGSTSTANNPTATYTQPGVYTVTLKVRNSLNEYDSITKTAYIDLSNAYTITVTHVDATCYNCPDGSASVAVNGGVAPYTYAWSNNSTAQQATGLEPGNYQVTVTDALGCASVATAYVRVICQPIDVDLLLDPSPSCYGYNDGVLRGSATSGRAPYYYTWYDPYYVDPCQFSPPCPPPPPAPDTLAGIRTGTYRLTVTDQDGCTGFDTINVVEPPAINVLVNTSKSTCGACNDGAINITASGGIGTLSYSIDGGGTYQSSSSFTNLTHGFYDIVVQDGNLCNSATLSARIDTPCFHSTTVTSTDVTCFGTPTGSATATSIGGTSPYSYSWSNGMIGGTITTVAAGTYFLTSTDASGCEVLDTFVILEPASALLVSDTATDVTCNSGVDGKAWVRATGGTPPYNYAWSGGLPVGNGDTIVNLIAGNYIATVTDVNGCTDTALITVMQPPPSFAITDKMDVSCFGAVDGSAWVTVIGGNGPFAYNWNVPNAFSDTVEQLPVGTYTVTITDNNGCVIQESVTITSPSAISISESITNASCPTCNNGAIDITVSGGSAGYLYLWSNGSTIQDVNTLAVGNYSVTVMDASGCTATKTFSVSGGACATTANINTTNVSCFGGNDGKAWITVTAGNGPYTYEWTDGTGTLSTTDTLTNVAADTFTVYVTDALACTQSFNVIVGTNQVLGLSANLTFTSCLACTDGAAEINVVGGTPPYTYAVNSGSYSASNTFGSLGVGSYDFHVRDALGCTETISKYIDTVYYIYPTLINGNVSCFGSTDGFVDIDSIYDGVPPFTYAWSNGSTNRFIQNLIPGTYTVTVTDANGVTGQIGTMVTQPSQISITESVTAATCGTCNDGSISLAISGGVPGYIYNWSIGANTKDVNALVRGNYSVTVTDANNCTAVESYVVDTICSHPFTSQVEPVYCFGGNAGSISITPSGATTLPWTYNWSNGATTANNINLAVGSYTLTITDVSGCSGTYNFVIMQDSIAISGIVTNETCTTCDNGEIDLSLIGGTPPYSYLWSNNSTIEDQTNLSSGGYNVTVTDATGCSNVYSFYVDDDCIMNVSLGWDTAVCFGTYDIVPAITGGVSPFTYLWNTGAVSSSLTVSSAGTFRLSVTDANGCIAEGQVNLRDTATSVLIVSDTTICLGQSVQLGVAGGSSYSWSPSGTLSSSTIADPIATPTQTTTYTVQVNIGSCNVPKSVTITIDTSCVWPGDADNSGLVDNDDVLAIGIAYGDTGPTRWFASIVWEAQPSFNWGNSLASGTNHKYVDTNGDGVIDADDTLAITLNYGLSHPKRDDERETSVPSIFIELPDSIVAGQMVQGDVYLGTSAFPLTNVYGVKFTMNYNPDFIENGSVSFNFGTSWMGTPGIDLLTFQKDLPANGRIDGAVTGINLINRSGYGRIGTANFTMKDDISGKDLISETLTFDFTNVRAIDVAEDELTVEGLATEVVATQTVGIRQVENTLNVAIFPNPAQNTLYINTYNQPLDKLTITNVLGVTFDVPVQQQNNLRQLDVSQLPAGVYIITLQSAKQMATERVILNR